MKYWYFVFEYQNDTTQEGVDFEAVIQSDKEHFPLKEVRETADGLIIKDSQIDPETDLEKDDYSVMISHHIEINKEDFDAFKEEFKK